MSDLVTVTAYRHRRDAGVAQGALDDAGIPSVIDAAERVKLRVEHLDAIRAGDVLTAECATLDEIQEADEERSDPSECARCGSPDIERPSRGVTFAAIATLAISLGVAVGFTDAAFLAILASGVALLISGRWRCHACGAMWD
jgi:hypothetical protein